MTLTMVKTECRLYKYVCMREMLVSATLLFILLIHPNVRILLSFLLLVLFAAAAATQEVKHVYHIQYRTILTPSNSISIEIQTNHTKNLNRSK